MFMSKMGMFFVVAAAIWVGLALADSQEMVNEQLLSQLCNHKGPTLKDRIKSASKSKQAELPTVGTIEQVKWMAKTLELGAEYGCSIETEQSILELSALVDSPNVCSRDHVDRIGRFYKDYIYKKGDHSKQLPVALKNFFIGYGFRVNKECKRNLHSRLDSESDRVAPSDFKLITDLNLGQTKLKAFFKDLTILAPFLDPNEGKLARRLKEKAIAVTRDSKQALDRLRAPCATKFKPIYDQLFIPVIRLSAFGFERDDDDDAEVRSWMSSIKGSYNYERWFQAILVCESIARVSVFERNDAGQTDDDDEVEVVPDDKVAELEASSREAAEAAPVMAPAPADEHHRVTVDPMRPLVDPDDAHLMQLIGHFDTKSKEAAKNRKATVMLMLEVLKSSVGGKMINFSNSNRLLRQRAKRATDEDGDGVAKRSRTLGKVVAVIVIIFYLVAFVSLGFLVFG